jgi:hypothetical protein
MCSSTKNIYKKMDLIPIYTIPQQNNYEMPWKNHDLTDLFP